MMHPGRLGARSGVLLNLFLRDFLWREDFDRSCREVLIFRLGGSYQCLCLGFSHERRFFAGLAAFSADDGCAAEGVFHPVHFDRDAEAFLDRSDSLAGAFEVASFYLVALVFQVLSFSWNSDQKIPPWCSASARS